MEQNVNPQFIKAEQELLQLIDQLKINEISVLPTETELADRLKVGRNTVRRVLLRYVNEGVLERIKGKGTFLRKNLERLSFSSWVPKEPPGDIFIDTVIKKFQSLHNQSSINAIAVNYDNYIKNVIMLALHGKTPDVIQINPIWLHYFLNLDLLLPLDGIIGQVNLKRRYTLEFEGERYGDHLYAVMWAPCPFVLYYNKAVMESAGLDPDSPPRFIDELNEMCVKFNRSGVNDISGIALPLDTRSSHPFYMLYPLILAQKGTLLDDLDNLIIDSEDNIKALKWLVDLYGSGSIRGQNGVNEGRILFASNRIAFWIDGPYGRGFFRQISEMGKNFDSQYGVVPIPIGATGRSESLLVGHSLAISKSCRNQELATQWVQYLTTDEENAHDYFELFGMLPPMRDLLHKPYFANNPFASVFIEQIETATIAPTRNAHNSKIFPFITQVIAKTILENLDPKAKLKELKEIIQLAIQHQSLVLLNELKVKEEVKKNEI